MKTAYHKCLLLEKNNPFPVIPAYEWARRAHDAMPSLQSTGLDIGNLPLTLAVEEF